jgi:uncharacterized OsmC-like protein
MRFGMPIVNDMDQEALFSFKDQVEEDSAKADRWPTVVAHWDGKSASRIEFEDKTAHIGGRGELNRMQFVLASLAACDVDLVAMHATMMGLEVESLGVEASGHFNVQSYIGLEDKPGAGYDQISYKLILNAPDATPEQMAYLVERCEGPPRWATPCHATSR